MNASWFKFFQIACVTSSSSLLFSNSGHEIFSLKVWPVIESKCISCHDKNNQKLKGDLDLSSLEGMLNGGETSDKVLVPGHPEKSLIVKAIEWLDSDYEMPPKENDRLTAKQIQSIRDWIQLGAPWPSKSEQKRIKIVERAKIKTDEGIIISNSGGLSDEWTYRRYKPEDIWAFQPIKPADIPDENINPIDFFIYKNLKKSNVSPAPIADFRTLVKRVQPRIFH